MLNLMRSAFTFVARRTTSGSDVFRQQVGGLRSVAISGVRVGQQPYHSRVR